MFSGVTPLHFALDYHLERHNVLSSNIAHVDTPGYHPNDLERVEPVNFENVLNVEMLRTSSMHVASPADAGSVTTGRTFEDLSAGVGQDGNYVSLDREASKVAANHLRYDVVSAVVSAELKQLAFAANDGKG
jgi:flagellar basal-body rod protein FlgB